MFLYIYIPLFAVAKTDIRRCMHYKAFSFQEQTYSQRQVQLTKKACFDNCVLRKAGIVSSITKAKGEHFVKDTKHKILSVETSKCIHARTRTHARTHVHTRTRTHAHIHTHARTHAHTHTHTYTHSHTRARTHACTHARTHTHTRAY